MVVWKTLEFSSEDIRFETEKAMLLELPKHCCATLDLAVGHKFWHPKKVIRQIRLESGENAWSMAISYDFRVKMFLSGIGCDKYKVAHSAIVSGSDLIAAWKREAAVVKTTLVQRNDFADDCDIANLPPPLDVPFDDSPLPF